MLEQRDALLRLLGDDDPATRNLVKAQLALAGHRTLRELRTLLQGAPPLAARHLRDVIADIEEREADAIFSEFCATFPEHGPLEEAVWRLATTFSPGETFFSQRQMIDRWGAEVARRLTKASTALDRVETLAEYLHDEVQLRGNEADYYNIENSLLPDVIETGLGIPLSLSVVYMMVGRRAGMSVEGVGLPGHFLVRHEDIFFDPFHGGRRIGLEECRELMRRQHLELRPEHLAAATPRQILLRMLANIFAIAEKTDPPLAEKLAGWIGSLRT
jgi:hypothetical protein